MLFKKKHKLIFNKPIAIIRDNLKSPNEVIKVLQINNTKLEGYIDFRYGTGGSIISSINLEEPNPNVTILSISNRFDSLMNMYILILSLVLWSFAIYEIINGSDIKSFGILIKITFPIIIIIMIKYTLHFYDKRIIKTYKSLIKNSFPN